MEQRKIIICWACNNNFDIFIHGNKCSHCSSWNDSDDKLPEETPAPTVKPLT